MLDTLMDISEAETGTMRLALAPTSISTTLVREVVSVYEDVAEDKQIDLRTALRRRGLTRHRRSRSPAPGAGQPGRQRHQIHAVGGTGDGQRSCRRTIHVRIEVADTGIGIAAHDLPRIWERLYRGDQSRAERGLGPRSQPRPRHRPGPRRNRDVSTEPGRGSTFTIRLPKSFAVGSNVLSPRSSSRSGLRIVSLQARLRPSNLEP